MNNKSEKKLVNRIAEYFSITSEKTSCFGLVIDILAGLSLLSMLFWGI